MKKYLVIGIMILSVGFVYVGNGISGDATQQAADLWSSLQSDKYQETWALWPGKGKLYKGTHPHGMLLTTYTNETAAAALAKGVKELPKGSVIVKENYMAATEHADAMLGAITVMDKTGDGKDDWFWVKYMPDGTVAKKEVEMDGKKMEVTLAGTPKGCVQCHAASVGKVHNIMTPLPK